MTKRPFLQRPSGALVGDAAGAADVAREAQSLIEQSPDRGGSALDHGLAGQIIERARQISA